MSKKKRILCALALSAAELVGELLGRGRGQSSLDCTFEEMHGGKHSWDDVATSEGGRVIRPD